MVLFSELMISGHQCFRKLLHLFWEVVGKFKNQAEDAQVELFVFI